MQPTTTPRRPTPPAGRILLEGEIPRANRVPRIARPQPGLYRRLRTAVKRAYLHWLLHDLGKQLDRIEADFDRASASRTLLNAPAVNLRLRLLRARLAKTGTRFHNVRQELDNMAGLS